MSEEKEKIEFEKNELIRLINDINTLLKEEYFIKLIEASYVTQDNSNLYQTAEIRTPDNYKFDKFLWISEKPYKYGVALYYKL
jgi:hypothetical protein